MGPSTVCNMPWSRTQNTSVGGQFGFGIFAGIHRNGPVFIMENPDSKALHALLFCFGLSGRKEDGKTETATLEERQKSNWSIKRNNNSAGAGFVVHFVAFNARPRRENASFSPFMEDVNKRRRYFPSLS